MCAYMRQNAKRIENLIIFELILRTNLKVRYFASI